MTGQLVALHTGKTIADAALGHTVTLGPLPEAA